MSRPESDVSSVQDSTTQRRAYPQGMLYRRLTPVLLLLAWPGLLYAQFTYSTVNGSITIGGYNGPGGTVVIPDRIGALPVTVIGPRAFRERTDVTSVTIPSSVTSIQSGFNRGYIMGAFCGCTNLAEVILGEGLKEVGAYAFYNCTRLGSVTMPDSVTNIAEWAMAGCSGLTNVIFGSQLESIGDSAFSDTGLREVTIPKSVAKIGNWTCSSFDNCPDLQRILVHPENPNYSSYDGALFDQTQSRLLKCPQARSGQWSVPDGVTTIDTYAFLNCMELTQINLPASVTSLKEAALWNCTNLAIIKVDPANAVYSDRDGMLFNTNQNVLVLCPEGKAGVADIPNTTIRIEHSAFSQCSMITRVVVPAGVTAIEDHTFYGCTGLTNVMLPVSVNTIGFAAFWRCSSLPVIDIPGSVGEIGTMAFEDCASLTRISVDPLNSVYADDDGILLDKARTRLFQCPGGRAGEYQIPQGVRRVSNRAFANCGKLTSVQIPASVVSLDLFGSSPPECDTPFHGCVNLTNISVDAQNASYRSIEGALYNKNGTRLLKFPGGRTGTCRVADGTTWIADFALFEFTGSLVIPADVTNVSPWALGKGTKGVYFEGKVKPRSQDSCGMTGVGPDGPPWSAYHHLPQAIGWETWDQYGSRIWMPELQNAAESTEGFGFIVFWAKNKVVVVETTSDLNHGLWSAIATNSLVSGNFQFRDSKRSSGSGRFYRVRAQ